MKYLFTLSSIIVFAMVFNNVIAQTGGMNIGSLQVSNSIQVGTASESVVLHSDLVSLPPLTNSEILWMPDPVKGTLVYAAEEKVLLVFDGIIWKRMDRVSVDYFFAPCDGIVYTDIDGNSFVGIEIGGQCWMSENLKVTHYPNGDPIPNVTENDAWSSLSTSSDAYCYYNNDESLGYGALYNYAAAQGACPDGWTLPTDEQWKILEGNVDTQYSVGDEEWDKNGWRGFDAGKHLKLMTGWNSFSNSDNSSGFSAISGGFRHSSDGHFMDVGLLSYWWTATAWSASARIRILRYNYADVYRVTYANGAGYSVRCIRE